MQKFRSEEHASSLSLHSVLFAIFRHKMVIIICTVLGLIGAAVVRVTFEETYESRAKLLVRYVVERSTVDPIDAGAGRGGESVVGSEAEILTSWDLALQVAEALGPEKILPEMGKAASKEAAAAAVARGLKVSVSKGSNIIAISYINPRPELTTLVLNELVNRYFIKHLEVHRSAGAFDFVSQQADQVRARLNQTEDALKNLKAKIGVASFPNSIAAINAELIRTEEQLRAAEAEVAEQRARVQSLELSATGRSQGPPIPPVSTPTPSVELVAPRPKPAGSLSIDASQPSPAEVERYKSLSARLTALRQNEVTLLSKYTPENNLVKLNESEMEDIQKQLQELRTKFPVLGGTTETSQQPDLLSERARLAGIEAKAHELQARLLEVKERFKELSDVAPQVAELERKKEMEETSYKYLQGTLEKARIDEALDPSKIPNISAVQRPSAPTKETDKRDKIVLMLAGGGLGLGLVLALLNELVINRTVKRPFEIETYLHIPPLMSIPYSNGRSRLKAPKAGPSPGSPPNGRDQRNIAPWDGGHFIRPYAEAIRDRLGLYFELNGLTHKPKLLGVTGFSDGAGTSTLAAGLAAALSEVGDGKVLLVDVCLGPGDVHPFFKGRPALSLPAALQPEGAKEPAAENLYLATVGSSGTGLAQLGLKKFFDMMPNLKASDFDYIIFDMPPLTQTSPTLGMAGFMDKMLLVVEAEENNRDLVKRGYAKLAGERDNISVVFNKARTYVPKWLDGES
jgi:uncharacterized protein involved in exopolysaccharide biosynthesis/Mrp family chromosome partitioning ATPase